MTKISSIAVKHEQNGDWHVFTSPELPGLCVAATDMQTAYTDVGPYIEKLILLNHALHVTATAESSYEDFFEGKARQIPVDGLLKRFNLKREAVPA